MQQLRLNAPEKTTIGGYGELHLNVSMPKGNDTEAEVDMHRLVLFFAHRFNDRISLYTEFEVEHALVGPGAPGQVGIEQATLDWRLTKNDAVYLRTGIVLVPMGVINQWHEPPIFHGVERPRVDTLVIPTTWREAAVGIWGRPIEGLQYELYLMSGMDADGFSGWSGLRGGRQSAAVAVTNGPAFAGRVEYEPRLRQIIGASFYLGFAGANAEDIPERVTVTGASVDWRMHLKGFEPKVEAAYFHVSDTDKLRVVSAGATDPYSTVGSDIFGVYGELAYDVFYTLETEHVVALCSRRVLRHHVCRNRTLPSTVPPTSTQFSDSPTNRSPNSRLRPILSYARRAQVPTSASSTPGLDGCFDVESLKNSEIDPKMDRVIMRLLKLFALAAFAAVSFSRRRLPHKRFIPLANFCRSSFSDCTRVRFLRTANSSNSRKVIETKLGYTLAKKDYVVYVAEKGDQAVGYAVFDSEIGQHEAIDFATFFDSAGKVTRFEVVAYREPYGDEIRGTRFRKQFVGRNAKSGFDFKRDVDAVSGATLSARAATKAVQRAAMLVEQLLNHNESSATTMHASR
ncbi:MAG: FMN-binding protein [Polyangiales bacterium]